MKSKKENKDFNRVQADLKANGFREKDVTIPSGKAMVLGIVYALPVRNNFGLIVSLSLIERAHLSEVGGLSFYIMFYSHYCYLSCNT